MQKSALKIILGEKYKGYKRALNDLCIESLDERRKTLCLKFAKRCLKNEKAMKMFPLHEKKHQMNTRNNKKFKVEHANTSRFKTSAIIYMQNLLNENEKFQWAFPEQDSGKALQNNEHNIRMNFCVHAVVTSL